MKHVKLLMHRLSHILHVTFHHMGVFATNLCFLPPRTHFLDPLLKLYYYFTTVHPVLGTTFLLLTGRCNLRDGGGQILLWNAKRLSNSEFEWIIPYWSHHSGRQIDNTRPFPIFSLIHTWRNSARHYDQKYRSVIQSIMGLSPILPKIQPVTIDTMVNNNGPLLNVGLNFVMCERCLLPSPVYI